MIPDLSECALKDPIDCLEAYKAYADYYYNDVMNNSNLPNGQSMSLVSWEDKKPKVKRITLEEYMSK